MRAKIPQSKIIALLTEMLYNVENDKNILLKDEAMLSVKQWGSLDWSRTKIDNANIYTIKTLFDKIEKILKSRIVNPALTGKNSSSFTQFYLKNAYAEDYKDKQEIELTGESMLDVIRALNDKGKVSPEQSED